MSSVETTSISEKKSTRASPEATGAVPPPKSNGSQKKSRPAWLNRIYAKLYAHCKGDPAKLTLFTIPILIASEIPLLHYDPDVASHLGVRKYPPADLIWKTFKDAEFNFIWAYVVPGTVLIKIAGWLGIEPYDTKEETLSWKRVLIEGAAISVISDILFYILHRIVHTKRFYKGWHKKHHEFKYSIAFAHHWMEFHEALIFALPQALPPMALWALTGRKCHIMSMWTAFTWTQLNAIVGHAGWRIPFVPSWLPFFQASYHDWHHVDYSANFGAMYPFTDMLFGTYLNAKMGRLTNGGKWVGEQAAKTMGVW